ncbi:MAG: GAF domain-containing protein [Burkholderiales bacterium]|nr:GAF domain-containing protein [Burkholderiales bacterium]
MLSSPPFGQADLSNCERELIHLAGSVQPHGLLLAIQEPALRIVQVSANAPALLGLAVESLLRQPLVELGGDIDARLRTLALSPDLAEPAPLHCSLRVGGELREFEGTVHRVRADLLLAEIEPIAPAGAAVETVSIGPAALTEALSDAVQRFSAATSIGQLADAVVRTFRDMLGYDRVMVYKFDPDGHGKIIAEARDPRLESLLGHHYPASDIPQRARELYLRNRLRVLVDVHYQPALLQPRLVPGSADELDMSMCYLRSMSPLHLQYLKNMGVTATLVVSLVREGRLWGLIACHHYSARNLRFSVRSAADLLAEVVSTRIAAIENYAHAQGAIQVRRLEQRLVEATSTEGDWRLALFRNPRNLLQPLEATGAALFHDGELLTAGEVPSTAELRALLQWIEPQGVDGLFSCNSVSRANPALDSLTPTASGVLAVKLSASRPDYLLWFRKEQLLTVTWAGDPSKPVVGNDPLELSPRRSFAAWSEIVRGTALPWTGSEIALGRAFGNSLIDIIVQINAVRLLIAEHQLSHIRALIGSSKEPVVIADVQGHTLFANDAFAALRRTGIAGGRTSTLDMLAKGELADLFEAPEQMRRVLRAVADDRRSWRGEMALHLVAGGTLPVAVRTELVAARDGSVLGFFVILVDLTDSHRVAEARRHLEQSLTQAGDDEVRPETRGGGPGAHGDLMAAILANASLAAMDIADGSSEPSVAPLLEEVEASTRRATMLYARIRSFGG